MKLSKRSISLFISLLLVSTVIAALFVPASASGEDSTEERVFTASWGTSSTADWGFPSPLTFYPRGPGYIMTSYCFDALVWPEESGDFTGLLAESWESSDDGLEWTFHLREGVTWHDGEPFTADDVVFTMDYIKGKASISPIGSSWYNTGVINSVEALDEHTVVITLNYPYAPFMQQVAAVIPIMPEHIWEDVEDPSKYMEDEAAIGTGPFILEDYDTDQQSYKYTANKDYFLGEPIIDTLIYVKTSDVVISLKTGEVDESGLTLDQVQALDESDNMEVISGPGYWVYRLRFNIPSNTILNDTTVRQAIYYSLNCSDIESRVLHGGGIEGNPGYVPPYSSWYNPDVTQYEYDIEKANQILDDAGYSETNSDGIRLDSEGNPLEFQLLYSSDQQSQRIAELVQTYLKEIGISITLKPGDTKTVDGLVGAGNFDLAIYSHGTSTDPARMLNSFPTSTGWNNSEFMALAEEQMSTMDEDERKELVDKMQVLIADNVPTIPLMYRNVYSATSKDTVTGFFYTDGGVGGGVPTEYNKLVFIYGTWNGDNDDTAEGTTENAASSIGILGSVAILACTFILIRRGNS
ncbi:ABC-type dipeptide transport system, periplasmic component [Methanolobus tindarius DSM 2278]|uniref:ABC-type dipeptide transport system, periplasmic component n=1 Tax=Methanolobus tindarius DSM 2278 TaxID=1090322 RepID=W9DP60_METTI|nr:ABC transporter substrate-binding protein [Methanolobus tindarius]ETA66923.1 ABC-type dipeptide transport system, periplasmic component [Methanolobus tindarius DSM 2278]